MVGVMAVATGTGVHSGDEGEICRISGAVLGACNSDDVTL